MDQCTHCTFRGNLPECVEAECSIHESWYATEMRKRIKAAVEAYYDHEPRDHPPLCEAQFGEVGRL